jgi:DNA-binding winged helix-turn-helix (wHTH) protein
MAPGSFRFDLFTLDEGDRQLRRAGEPVPLNARYFDALALLVRDGGKLVSKNRFLDEVWDGIPVTDEALTQCIRTLRKQLGDDAARPRFIETVPKHGYRFIAPVTQGEGEEPCKLPPPTPATSGPLRTIVAGTLGAGAAGIAGGVFYGFAAAADPAVGAISVLLVLLAVTALLALIGGAGVAAGIAVAERASARGSAWMIVGGSAGGIVVGALVKLVGLDAFHILFGRSPGEFTGAGEGALLGGAVGLALWLAHRRRRLSLRAGVALAAVLGALAGVLITLAGGHLMGGSLDLLASSLPGSRLRLDGLAALFGEASFGPAARTLTAALEGSLFTACMVAALLLARRRDPRA